ncbi:TraB/GumN family protein [soil metagenome]
MRMAALLLAGLAALLPAGCGRSDAITARPALWRATNGPVTVWLFGSMHLLPKDVAWQGPAIDRAVADSDSLILEVPGDRDPKAQAAIFLRHARTGGLPPIAARVSDPSALDKAIAAAGTSAATLDGLKSWAAAVLLGTGAGRAQGASAEYGVEAVLARRFADKPQEAFESVEGQLTMLDTLPEPAQRVLLDQAVADAANGEANYRATLAAWSAGDTSRIAATFDRDFAKAPALEEVLITQRNRRWADAIAARKGGTVLVAVGAGHMVGTNALPALLNARGFRVARVQ